MIDRNVEFPNRFQLQKVQGTDDIYDIIPAPGDVIAPGDLFSKGNMLPDEIVSLLGLKMANPQVKDALNVLANVGNLHVWERVQTYSEPVPEVPAGYTLGPVETDVQLFTATSSKDSNRFCNAYYSKKLAVSNDGTVALANESTAAMYANTSGDNSRFAGAFVKLFGSTYSDSFIDYLFYIPEDSVLTAEQATGQSNWKLTASKLQRVTGYPYTPAIPAGTHVDYLTSTDPNAHPKQSAEGGQDAYYELGDVQSISVELSSSTGIMYSSSVSVSDDGIVNLVSPSTGSFSTSSGVVTSPDLKGKYVEIYGLVGVWFILEDSKGTHQIGMVSYDKAQPVTGHAAIPANITITYLGQLGDGARIEVGSYVGTGTYGRSNPNSLTFGLEPKLIVIDPGNWATNSTVNWPVIGVKNHPYLYRNSNYENRTNLITWLENGVEFYSANGDSYQLNTTGVTYYYIAIG